MWGRGSPALSPNPPGERGQVVGEMLRSKETAATPEKDGHWGFILPKRRRNRIWRPT